jgi:hypothetical protein
MLKSQLSPQKKHSSRKIFDLTPFQIGFEQFKILYEGLWDEAN